MLFFSHARLVRDLAPSPVARSIRYILDNLPEPMSLKEIARASGYSRFHFLRLFKKETGHTPHAFVMKCRIERSMKLLREGVSLADAAYATGFSDQAHFSRRFKELVGITPGEYVRNPCSHSHCLGKGSRG